MQNNSQYFTGNAAACIILVYVARIADVSPTIKRMGTGISFACWLCTTDIVIVEHLPMIRVSYSVPLRA